MSAGSRLGRWPSRTARHHSPSSSPSSITLRHSCDGPRLQFSQQTIWNCGVLPPHVLMV